MEASARTILIERLKLVVSLFSVFLILLGGEEITEDVNTLGEVILVLRGDRAIFKHLFQAVAFGLNIAHALFDDPSDGFRVIFGIPFKI